MTWLFMIWVLIEICGFIWVAKLVGTGMTLLLVLASMVAGALLMRREGFRAANLFMTKLRNNQRPSAEELTQTPFAVIGSILLIIPGFFSDVLGILCFVPAIRRYLLGKIARSSARRPADNDASLRQGRTFDGEFKEQD